MDQVWLILDCIKKSQLTRLYSAIEPLTGNLTFHRLSAYISGTVAIFVTIIAIFLTMMHATHFSDPRKQKQ